MLVCPRNTCACTLKEVKSNKSRCSYECFGFTVKRLCSSCVAAKEQVNKMTCTGSSDDIRGIPTASVVSCYANTSHKSCWLVSNRRSRLRRRSPKPSGVCSDSAHNFVVIRFPTKLSILLHVSMAKTHRDGAWLHSTRHRVHGACARHTSAVNMQKK